MSKVICDVCGTAFPDTAAVCPICNSARNSAEQTAAAAPAGNEQSEIASHVSVRGGRFSKKNVRRRGRSAAGAAQSRGERRRNDDDEPNNTGLIVVVILLLLAIVAVVIYIGVHFFGQNNGGNQEPTGPSVSNTEAPNPTDGTELTEVKVPCQSIQLSNKVIEFTEAGEFWTLDVALNPVNTTDTVTFTSSDESVATVSNDGTIYAVGGGEAVITVFCGEIFDTCSVTCSFGSSNVDDPTEDTGGVFIFEFNTIYTDSSTGYGDTTLDAPGKTWRAYKNSLTVELSEITWISDDPSVCTIENGIVTAVGPGKTLIHAQCNGVTYTCIVRCNFKVAESDPTEPDGSTDATEGGDSADATEPAAAYTINKEDVTIAVGETFKLTLTDSLGNVVDVTWTADGTGVSIDGNKITGVYSGKFNVSVTYEGVTYSCIVRVK